MMDPPIVENDPQNISLDGEDDPFPLSPEEQEENKAHDQQIEEMKKEIKAMRIHADENANVSYSRIDNEMNESLRVFPDEYENVTGTLVISIT